MQPLYYILGIIVILLAGYLVGRYHVLKTQAAQTLKLHRDIEAKIKETEIRHKQILEELKDPEDMLWEEKLNYITERLKKNDY